jgi:hypothetical protein
MEGEPKEENLLPEGEILRVSEKQAAGAFFCGLFLLIIGAATLLSRADNHNVSSWVAPLTGIAGIALGTYLIARSRAGLKVESDGVSLQGAFRRRSWRWTDVKHFELTEALYGPGLQITLVDGEVVGVRGFSWRSKSQRDLAEAWAGELNSRTLAAAQ